MACKRPDHLFLSSDGNLYDTRAADWPYQPPLREGYRGHITNIVNARQLKAALRAGKTTDLGGYPLFLLTAGGDTLSFEALAKRHLLEEALAAYASPSSCAHSCIVACAVNWEDADMTCDETGDRIPSAYGSDGE